ncbi:MAG: HAMP domain-containing histidine kinase [bacterium]|nr:HAMP domain-containing histidine kinase [bacterium]
MEGIWIIAVVCLAAAMITAWCIVIRYRRQVNSICRQLQFIKNHQTNMKLSADGMQFGMGRLAEEVNGLLTGTEEKRRAVETQETVIKETITNLSHDIRTPLTSLDGYVQLLEESDSKEEQARYIGIIRRRIEALRGILDELFLYTRLQDNAYAPSMERVELNRLVCDAAFSFYEDCRARGLEPQVSVCEERVYTRGNETMIVRMLQNIIKNSLEHGKADVRIRLTAEGQRVIFSCANRVEHAEEIDVERVFERFYRADKARANSSTGLGLSIARGLAEKMNAKMSASLEDGLFTVTAVFERLEEELI